MRHIAEQFTDDEFQRLKAGKGDRSWREAMLDEIAASAEAVEGRG
ncbi:hypothetical protein [Halonotius terrestris]|nr:hypothetical protein [Halonotius terrestris]